MELHDGIGEIFTEIDPDIMRERFRKKQRGLHNKLTTVKVITTLPVIKELNEIPTGDRADRVKMITTRPEPIIPDIIKAVVFCFSCKPTTCSGVKYFNKFFMFINCFAVYIFSLPTVNLKLFTIL